MKKIPTVLLTFMMLAVLCAGCASEKDEKAKQIDAPYVYPIQPGTEEWAKLDSLDAKIDACKVDPELMNSMTTEALLETVLDYPLLPNIYAFSSAEIGIGSVSGYFEGLQMLHDREDAAECIQKAIDAGTDDPLRMQYLQTLATYVADETWGPGFLKR